MPAYTMDPRIFPSMHRASLRFLAVFALTLLCRHPALLAQGRGGATAAGPVPRIEERTSGMQKIDGYFPLYWDERTGSLWLEIPRLDSEFLYTTGLAAGLGSNDIGLDRGQEGGSRVVSFQRVEGKRVEIG